MPKFEIINIFNFVMSPETSFIDIFENTNPDVTICYYPDKISDLSLYLSDFKNKCTELCCNGVNYDCLIILIA